MDWNQTSHGPHGPRACDQYELKSLKTKLNFVKHDIFNQIITNTLERIL